MQDCVSGFVQAGKQFFSRGPPGPADRRTEGTQANHIPVGLVEGKSFGVNPTRYAHPWGALALVPAERRAREEMRARMKTVDAIDAARHAHVRPPPLRERVEGLGGLKVVTVGGFCEFNHVVHEFVEQATRAIVDARRMRGRGGGRGAQVRAER